MKYSEQPSVLFLIVASLLVVLTLVFKAGITLLIPALLAVALSYIVPELLEKQTQTLEIVTTIDNIEEAS